MASSTTQLTIFRWGYEGWGSSVPELLRVTEAVERSRGFGPPVFVDVRFSRSVRAAGFRDRAFEKTLGPERYVWMQSLGNAAFARHDGTIRIHDPEGAEDLLDRATGAAAKRRRVIFFCSCGLPQHCHRCEVERLVRARAKRRRIAVEVVEWPGGAPTREVSAKISVKRSVLNQLIQGKSSVPLGDEEDIECLAGVPWGSLILVDDGERPTTVSVGPARYSAGAWSMPVFIVPILAGHTAEDVFPAVADARAAGRFADGQR